MTDDPLNGLDSKINVRGYFERVLAERDRRDAERDRRLDERFEGQEKAVAAALQAAEKAVNAALAAAEKAVDKAQVAQAKVNEGQNEFRGQLKDQNAQTERTMMPRTEAESLVRELRDQISSLREDTADLRSRIDVGPPSLSTLQSRSDENRGRQTFGAEVIPYVIAAAGVLLAIASRF